MSAEFAAEDFVVRFVEAESGAYVELVEIDEPRRVRCSPYHLYRVLADERCVWSGDGISVARRGDQVRMQLSERSIQVPARSYEIALREAFGIVRAA